jgi:acetyl esterase/lipase
MASTELREMSATIREHNAAPVDPPPDVATRRRGMDETAQPVPDDVTVKPVDAAGVPGDWVRAPGADAGRRMLYLHGGGYVIGSPTSHRRLASDISRASGCSLLVLDYRMAPEDPFPAAVDDALAALRWMGANGPDGASEATETFIAGDSAGGGLTLSTLVSARDAGDTLPKAAVTLSAWTDLAATGASMQTRAEADPMVSADGLAGMAGMYAGDAGLDHPLVSPLYADLSGLPPLLMQVGDAEVLLDDTTRLAEKIAAAGGDVTTEIEPEAFHIYQYVGPTMPEATAAIERIGAFIREHG